MLEKYLDILAYNISNSTKRNQYYSIRWLILQD